MSQILNDLRIGEETKLSERFMGKQLYARLINFGTLPMAGEEKAVAHGITGMDQFGIDHGRSYVDQGNGNRHALTYPNAVANGFWRAKVNETDVCIQSGQDRSAFTAVICVWYTKADELPGTPDLMADLEELRNEVAALKLRGNAGYELCELYTFLHPVTRPGFAPADGRLIERADEEYPLAYAYLQTQEGSVLRKTLPEWQAMSAAAPWEGIGGVPFFVLDTCAKTIKLPDLRGMYAESAGFDGMNVGGTHGDAIRNITGRVTSYTGSGSSAVGGFREANGALKLSNPLPNVFAVGAKLSSIYQTATFDASTVIPTANKNQPRAYGVNLCVYLGGK